MTLRDIIKKHYANQNKVDEYHTFKYYHSDGHQALIREIQALNADQSFSFKIHLDEDKNIVYSEVDSSETTTIKHVINYLDDLKRTLIELDHADKLGHIAKVSEDGSEEFYIDLLERGKQIYINVDSDI